MKKILSELLAALLACTVFSSFANEVKLEQIELANDQPTLERGAGTVVTVCMGCHSLKYIRYRDLLHLGIAKDKIDAWRGSQPLNSALQSQLSADDASAAFGGARPPDLSLMAAAREGEGRYLYSYLIGYHINDKGVLSNKVFPETRMPDILDAASATDKQQRTEISNKAKDVSSFLIWAADPHAQERKHIGIYVLIYVALMTALLFMWKMRIWRDVDMRPKV